MLAERLIDHLVAAGSEVLFSEVDVEIIGRYRDEMGLQFVPAGYCASTTDCEIYAPCALGGVLNEDTIPQLKCRAVALVVPITS